MKKALIYIIGLIFICSTFSTNAYYNYYGESIDAFINSPSYNELENIEDKKLYVCEKVFLEAYMRRGFTDLENRLCSDIFERKIEAQLNYMRYVMGERGIY